MDFGEIYLIKNKINNKCYTGQAVKFYGKNNKEWGSKKRWNSHIREAFCNGKDHCRVLNSALRKYGIDNFELIILGEYKMDLLNEKEVFFIEKYNTLVPNGYNLTTGGYSGKDSDETRYKKRLMRLGKKNSTTHIENSQLGQIGNRRKKGKRKYEEDNNLPKYICAHRVKKIIIGYNVHHFPIGVNKKEYINKSFTSIKNSPEENLKLSINYLEKLKIKYADLEQTILTAHNSRREKRVIC